MKDLNKLGLMTEEELAAASQYDVILEDTFDMTSSNGKKAAQVALAAGPAAAVFLPIAPAAAPAAAAATI